MILKDDVDTIDSHRSETGAGTATVTKALAETINDGAADGDRVSGPALQDRVRYNEGKTKLGNSQNNQPTSDRGETPQDEPSKISERQNNHPGSHQTESKPVDDHETGNVRDKPATEKGSISSVRETRQPLNGERKQTRPVDQSREYMKRRLST